MVNREAFTFRRSVARRVAETSVERFHSSQWCWRWRTSRSESQQQRKRRARESLSLFGMRLSRGTDTRPVRSLTVLDVRRRRFLRRAHHQQDRRSSRPLYRSGWICPLHGFTLELQHPRDFRICYCCRSDSRRLCWATVDRARIPHFVLCDGGDEGKVVRSLLVRFFSALSGRSPRAATEDWFLLEYRMSDFVSRLETG